MIKILSMKPAKTGEILKTGIYAVRNCLYLIETSGGYIMVDAGSNRKAVKQSLMDLKIDPLNIKHILLTHTDSDHTAALSLFTDAQIYLSEDELQMINGTTKRSFILGYNTLRDKIDLDKLSLLKNNQELIFGEHTIECIKTPGHTRGSMVYLLDGQYLFTGDAFSVAGGVMLTHPFTMDEKTAEESIKNFDEVIKRSALVITAHYGFYKADELKIR